MWPRMDCLGTLGRSCQLILYKQHPAILEVKDSQIFLIPREGLADKADLHDLSKKHDPSKVDKNGKKLTSQDGPDGVEHRALDRVRRLHVRHAPDERPHGVVPAALIARDADSDAMYQGLSAVAVSCWLVGGRALGVTVTRSVALVVHVLVVVFRVYVVRCLVLMQMERKWLLSLVRLVVVSLAVFVLMACGDLLLLLGRCRLGRRRLCGPPAWGWLGLHHVRCSFVWFLRSFLDKESK